MNFPSRHRAHRIAGQDIPVSRMRAVDLFVEAVYGILQRPARSAMTAMGTVLGVGVLIAVLGLTASASTQISKRFDPATAYEVSLTDPGDTITTRSYTFRPDAEDRVQHLNGVTHAGIGWMLQGDPMPIQTMPAVETGDDTQTAQTTPVMAASSGLLREAGAVNAAGRGFTTWEDTHAQRVAVIGPQIARSLGMSDVPPDMNIWINGISFHVVGILKEVQRHAEMLSATVIPATTARQLFGDKCGAGTFSLWATVNPGAVQVVAQQLSNAVNPTRAASYRVTVPPDPRSLRDQVNGDMNTLLILLACVSLVVGMVGIANTTFVSVVERTKEIGLRRSLGAKPRHVTYQFICEAILLGLLGGIVGSSIGVISVVLTCLIRGWTAVLDPRAAILGPLAGLLVGGIAGLYPAWRASRIEPVEAMRQT